jgi:hypothetical protein
MFKVYYLIPLLIPAALVKGDCSMGLFHRLGRWMAPIAARPVLALVVVACSSLSICAGIGFSAGIPAPQVHDEFGYLLLADTFAHGRLTNPPPPLWEHFETIHEIMQPSYTAKYPPAQGLALAFGEWMGRPIYGVWLTTALACAAICWMLYAWLPPPWAFAGGMLAVLHPQMLEWSQNYWGGDVALAGGALIAGSFRRLLDVPRPRDSIVMGIGMAILANSRPYEGLAFSVLTGLLLSIWWVRTRSIPLRLLLGRVAAPMSVVIALLGCQMAYYNWRVTGDPLVMPYMVHMKDYAIDPLFVFSAPRPEPVYRHREIQNLQEEYLRYYEQERSSWRALAVATFSKLAVLGQAYLWSFLLVVPLVGIPWVVRRDLRFRIALLLGFLFLLSIVFETWMHSHYAAPGAVLFFVLVMASMREVSTWHSHGRRWGRNVIRGLAVLLAISFVMTAAKLARPNYETWYYKRAVLLQRLNDHPGRSLVIVEYEPDHNPNREWVYNEADIPGAKVIIARDMGPVQNNDLIVHYPGRQVWVVNADAPQPDLKPYPGT